MGGSQLKQLRSTLKDQGLSSHGQNQSKKRKRSSSAKGSAGGGGPSRAEKLAAIHESFNTFDTKLNKRKFDVDQQKRGKPGQSKQVAIDQRRRTLLPELQNRNRTGGILDRRIGENDNSVPAEERALERFALEQQRLHAAGGSKRRSGFNLEEEDELTHLGRSLGGEDPRVGAGLADQQDAFQLSLKRKPAGAASDSENDDEEAPRKKSRAEIMDEVIKKSKMYKHERQKAREEDDELRLELDDGLEDLRAALRKDQAKSNGKVEQSSSEAEDEDEDESGSSDGEEEDQDESATLEETAAIPDEPQVDRDLLAQLLKGSSGNDEAEPAQKEANAPEEPPDAYDQAVKELTFERRVRPTDRLKTEDERIHEAAEALKAAEESRQRRMRGEADEEEAPQRSRASGMPGADDLDDFDLGATDLGQGLQAEGADDMEGGVFSLGRASDDEEDDEEDEEEDDDSDDDDEGEEDEEEGSEAESDLAAELEEEDEPEFSGSENEQDLVQSSSSKRTKAQLSATPKSEGDKMGFVFPCPDSHAEFLDILAESPSAASLGTVIDRIRTLHHPKLAAGNNEKLATFLGVLLDHVLYLTAATSPDSAFDAVNVLTPHIFSLSNAYPLAASTHFRAKLSLMHKNFLRGASKGVMSPEAKTWPGTPELVLLRLTGLVWSASDLSHPVVAPAMLLICEYLSQARVRSLKDVQAALFLCSLVLQYESMSKRIVPEALNLLSNSILLLAPHSFTGNATTPGSFPIPDAFRPELSNLKVKQKKGNDELSTRLSLSAEADAASLLYLSLTLIDKFAELWVSSVAFIEMMGPLQALLAGVVSKKVSSQLQDRLQRTRSSLERMLKLAQKERKPLRLQSHKPVPIPTFIPKFEEGYQPGRPAFDPDTARNETAKLKALVKKERKGAIRELRKDNRFIAEERARMRDEKDQAYNAKIRSIHAGLESERAEEKDYQRTKARAKAKDRKRAGGGGGR